MNNKINFDVNAIDIIYNKYKKFIPPIGVILVCVFLFFFVIIPQIQSYLSLLNQTTLEDTKLVNLKNNLNFLNNLNESKLSNQVQIVSSVLPLDKDFGGVLYALSAVSAKSGILLGNYSFQVGKLAEKSANTNFPFLSLNIQLNSNVLNTVKFIKELYRTVPVAEITKINVEGDSSQVTINFYYQPVRLVGFVDQAVPISALSQKETALINDLSTWNNASNQNPFIFLPEASSSANPFGL